MSRLRIKCEELSRASKTSQLQIHINRTSDMSQIPTDSKMPGVDPNVPLEQQFPPPPYSQTATETAAPLPGPGTQANTGQSAGQPYFPPPPGQAGHIQATAADESIPPPQPPRPLQTETAEHEYAPPQPPRPGQAQQYEAPPQRLASSFADDDPSNPVHYTRDPHRLIG